MCTKRLAAGEQSFPIRSWLLYFDTQAASGTRMRMRMRARMRIRMRIRMRMRMRMGRRRRRGGEEEQTVLNPYNLNSDGGEY